jgi:hypothetical protein
MKSTVDMTYESYGADAFAFDSRLQRFAKGGGPFAVYVPVGATEVAALVAAGTLERLALDTYRLSAAHLRARYAWP